MAHFARIDRTGTVTDVIKVDDAVLLDEDGNEVEEKGIEFLQELFGGACDYRQTSYNACKGRHRFQPQPTKENPQPEDIFDSKPCLRKNYAAIGGKYDYVRDAFIPPRTNATHVVLDEEGCQWECPYQSNQVNDNNGRPLGYQDKSDYTVNASFNPKGWVWDDMKKTYYQVPAFEEVQVNYQYDPQQKMWVKTYF